MVKSGPGLVARSVWTRARASSGDWRVMKPGKIVFLGSMDWQPNIDCVLYFNEAIWPRIKAADPQATFVIVGRKPPEKVLATYAPEQRLAGLAPEQRVAGLAPEQVVLTLPDDVLRALSDSYIDSLAEPTRTIIRNRLAR